MTTSDISDTLAPKSDQLDAIELIGHPRTFTVTKVVVRKGEDQPVDVHLAEFPRVWRPNLSMRRVLASCWGRDSSQWTGHRVTLYCDEAVRFGSETVGGTRISHVSHIDKPRSIPLPSTRGKAALFRVQPLPEPTTDERVASLREEWKHATPERKKAIEAEVAVLGHTTEPGPQTQDVATDPAEPLDDPTLDPAWTGGNQ